MSKNWYDVSSPEIEYITDETNGVKLFNELVPNKKEYIYDICEKVCKYLYKEPNEVPYFGKLTLRVEEFEGIAWKSGQPPHITVAVSSKYLESYNGKGGDITEEVKGILFHELTHAYQHSTNQDLSAIEGTADLIRYLAGYIPIELRSIGGEYSSSYKTTGFFFDWIRAKFISDFDFLYELNQSASPENGADWSWDIVKKITNDTVENLWKEYQQELTSKGINCLSSINQ